jgi:hypothetical protein
MREYITYKIPCSLDPHPSTHSIMPFFEGAHNTAAGNSDFNDVAGNQYLTEDRRHYAGDDRPAYSDVTHGDVYRGTVQGGNVGGRGNYYGDTARAATAPATTQQRLNPSASAAADDDNPDLLEAQLALVREQHETRRNQQRADRLATQLAETQARLTIAESELSAARQELAKYKPGGF